MCLVQLVRKKYMQTWEQYNRYSLNFMLQMHSNFFGNFKAIF
jgi:hypothetical protein